MEQLKSAQKELNDANTSVAQYKAISSASETSLKGLKENMEDLQQKVLEKFVQLNIIS